jgi:hypothetical protein
VISSDLTGACIFKASARFLASWAVGVHLTEAEGAGVDVGVTGAVALTPARLALALATAPPPGKARPAWAFYRHKSPQSTSRRLYTTAPLAPAASGLAV